MTSYPRKSESLNSLFLSSGFCQSLKFTSSNSTIFVLSCFIIFSYALWSIFKVYSLVVAAATKLIPTQKRNAVYHTYSLRIHPCLGFCPNLCWHFILSSNMPCGSLQSLQSCMCCCLEIPAAKLVSTWKRHPLYQTYHIYQMQGNCSLRQHPKNKMYAKKKYFTVNFTHLMYKVCKMLSAFTIQWHCLRLHSQCLHLPHTNY
jgi:hypothetical protein